MAEKNHNEIILAFPRDVKIQVLRDALEQNNISMFVQLSKILLEATISNGGLETEIIESIHNQYVNGLREDLNYEKDVMKEEENIDRLFFNVKRTE